MSYRFTCVYADIVNDIVSGNDPDAVQQFLANNDPDVDAIYRLTQPMPVNFADGPCRAIPPRTLVPYNSQATLHHYSAFWGLLLPISVHGRVSEIWRGYFNQPILWTTGSRLSVCPAAVNQIRNVHDYLRDFESEVPLYLRVPALLDILLAWKPSGSLPNQIRSLWIEMYERGVIEEEDVRSVQGWLADLESIGYMFPVPLEIEQPKLPNLPYAPKCNSSKKDKVMPLFDDILLVVNYNTPYYESSCFLRELWGDMFGGVVFFGFEASPEYGVLYANISNWQCNFNVGNTCGLFFDDSMAEAVQLFPGYAGYLFTQDDLFFNADHMVKLNRSRIWSTKDLSWGSLEAKGDQTRYYNSAGLIESGCWHLHDKLPRGTHDMYYLPARLAPKFAKIARTLRRHGIESEGAGPIALRCVTDDEIEEWRGSYFHMQGRNDMAANYGKEMNFIHPMKYSNLILRQHALEWKRAALTRALEAA